MSDAAERQNAILLEALRRIVGHLEYEALQGDGIPEDAWDDFHAAKYLLGHTSVGTLDAAIRGTQSIADAALPATPAEVVRGGEGPDDG